MSILWENLSLYYKWVFKNFFSKKDTLQINGYKEIIPFLWHELLHFFFFLSQNWAFIYSFRHFEIVQADINLPSKKISFILLAILEIRYFSSGNKIPVKSFQTPSLRHLSNNKLNEK